MQTSPASMGLWVRVPKSWERRWGGGGKGVCTRKKYWHNPLPSLVPHPPAGDLTAKLYVEFGPNPRLPIFFFSEIASIDSPPHQHLWRTHTPREPSSLSACPYFIPTFLILISSSCLSLGPATGEKDDRGYWQSEQKTFPFWYIYWVLTCSSLRAWLLQQIEEALIFEKLFARREKSHSITDIV